MVYNAAAAYQNSKIQTASKADLTLMLYEGVIKFCNLGLIAIEKKDYEKANTNIQKAQKVINELIVTLDHKYPVAEDYEKLYRYIKAMLLQSNIKKDPEMLTKALNEIRDLRDIWKQIMSTARTKQ